jgi:hypothetical protein
LEPCQSDYAAPTPRSIEVFYSYAHEDEAFVRELEKQLSVLKRIGVITTWYDRQIEPGSRWQRDINDHLASARVIVLMVSSDFINSDYCWDREVLVAMQRHELGTAVVVPIVLRETAFLDKTPFGKLQMLPKDALPVVQWPRSDEVCASIAKALGDVCLDMQHREFVAADAAQASRIYADIVASAQRQRAEREQIMKNMQGHILRSVTTQRGSAPAFKQASAVSNLMDNYIQSDGAPKSRPH